ncbi:MAG: glycosyltransferase family 2 protein [bacterium]
MKVSIVIVAYNSFNHLKACLDSVLRQTYPDYEIIVIDNNSRDGSLNLVKENYPMVKTLRNVNNLGYCRANNQGIMMTRGDYVLTMNPDIMLDEDFLKTMIEKADSLPQAGSFGPKLLRLINNQKSDMLDSSGLKILPYYKIVERGSGEHDKGQYDQPEEVFGISGACVMYSKSALEVIKENNQYFDERFFLYKEDVDLAWRLKEKGWQSWYLPKALAWHKRTASGNEKTSNWKTIRERRKRKLLVSYYSYRNHLLLLTKHLNRKTFWKSAWLIIPYEIGKFAYLLLFETRNIKGFFDYLKIK